MLSSPDAPSQPVIRASDWPTPRPNATPRPHPSPLPRKHLPNQIARGDTAIFKLEPGSVPQGSEPWEIWPDFWSDAIARASMPKGWRVTLDYPLHVTITIPEDAEPANYVLYSSEDSSSGMGHVVAFEIVSPVEAHSAPRRQRSEPDARPTRP